MSIFKRDAYYGNFRCNFGGETSFHFIKQKTDLTFRFFFSVAHNYIQDHGFKNC